MNHHFGGKQGLFEAVFCTCQFPTPYSRVGSAIDRAASRKMARKRGFSRPGVSSPDGGPGR
nr:hypothetical protein [Nocardia sputi]